MAKSGEDWEEGCEDRPNSSENGGPNGGDEENDSRKEARSDVCHFELRDMALDTFPSTPRSRPVRKEGSG